MVANPEILHEGAAIEDRIVMATRYERAALIIKDVYRALSDREPIVMTS